MTQKVTPIHNRHSMHIVAGNVLIETIFTMNVDKKRHCIQFVLYCHYIMVLFLPSSLSIRGLDCDKVENSSWVIM